MVNKLIFLRHAQTKIDPSIAISNWSLSESGTKTALLLSEETYFHDVDTIISSVELKAQLTVNPLAKKLQKRVFIEQGLEELDRGSQYITSQADYRQTVKQTLENPNISIKGWETANSALERFTKAITRINHQYTKSKILIVSHGIVLTLYFGSLLNIDHNYLFNRWQKLEFGSWGIVENSKLVKDIIE